MQLDLGRRHAPPRPLSAQARGRLRLLDGLLTTIAKSEVEVPDHARREIDVTPRLFARQLELFAVRNRGAKTRITLSAKKGVWLTRKRNCFCPTGTSFTSPATTAVALRGAS